MDCYAGSKGDPITVLPWQRMALRHIYARKASGRRRHRFGAVGVGRKNGKSGIGAGIALAALTTEQQGGQIISAAADRLQAGIIFEAAKDMVRLNPVLDDEIRIYTHALEHRTSGSVYRAISADAFTKEGLSPTLVLADELHAWPKRDLYDVLDLAMGARKDPLFLALTTAGVMSTRTEEMSILYELYLYCQSIVRGEVDDPTHFMAWWEADDDPDVTDPKQQAMANPGLGVILDADEIMAKAKKATGGAARGQFVTKRLNKFVATEDLWLPDGAWKACEGEPPPDTDDEIELWTHGLDRKKPVCVGIDVGIVHDYSAVTIAQALPGDEELPDVKVRGRYWMNPHKPGTVMHDEWRMPIDELVQWLRTLRELFPRPAAKIDGISVPGPAYVYDRYGLASAELTLEAERGFALIPVPQQGGWMVEASRRFYEAVVDGRIEHDGDPTLAAHLDNVVPRQVGESGWRLEKASKARKIDAAVAAVMAVSQALEAPPKPRFRAFAA